jgi:hypothetical protein
MANHQIVYQFNFAGNLNQGLLQLTGNATKATNTLGKFKISLANIANLGFVVSHAYKAFQKLNGAIMDAQRAYNTQMVAERQLEQVMRNTIGATDEQIKSIKEYAAAQQKLGVIGDEVQLAGAKELATYLTKTESLKTLMPMMNDMLAHQYGLNASQEQAVNIALMVGKVLDGQVGALSRVGYRFTEAEEKVLKFGNEEERVAMLSQIVTKYVGGVNAALAATPEGKLKQHANNMGDLKERIGGLIVTIKSALLPLQVHISEVIEKIVSFFENNRAQINKFITQIVSVLKIALNVITTAFQWCYTVVKNFYPLIIALYTGIVAYNMAARITAIRTKAAASGTSLWAIAQKKLNVTLLKSPIFLWVSGITLAITGIVKLVGVLKKHNSQMNAATRLTAELAAKVAIEKEHLNELFDALKKTNPESEERKRIIKELNEKYPEFLRNQNLEKANEQEIEIARRASNDELERSIILQGWRDKQESTTKNIDAEKQTVYAALKTQAKKRGWTDVGIMDAMTRIQKGVQEEIESGNYRGTYFNNDQEIHLLQKVFGTRWERTPGGGQHIVIDNDMVQQNKELFGDLMDVMLENTHELKAITDYAGAMGVLKKGKPFALPGATSNTDITEPTDIEKVSDTATSIATEGSKNVRNVVVNINKLVETITVSVTNLKESKEQIKAQVSELLITAVNDVNLAS